MKIYQFSCLKDNYNYILHEENTGKTAVVDPSTFEDTLLALKKHNIYQLDFILNTHHHPDHVGGNAKLKDHFNCLVVGSSYDQERIPHIDTPIKEGDFFALGDSKAQIYFTPGHTRGHIVYYFKEEQALFCGDTLFSMGCGRLFEGSPEQMFHSLAKIKALPQNTKIFCAHEYTLKNAQFALSIEPNNEDLKRKYSEVVQFRKQNKPTVPSLLADELKVNPFLRAKDFQTLAKIRQQKDHF